MRLGEMLNARFSDVDFENATLLLRKTKSGRPRLVAVPEEGMAVIRESFSRIAGMTGYSPPPAVMGQ